MIVFRTCLLFVILVVLQQHFSLFGLPISSSFSFSFISFIIIIVVTAILIVIIIFFFSFFFFLIFILMFLNHISQPKLQKAFPRLSSPASRWLYEFVCNIKDLCLSETFFTKLNCLFCCRKMFSQAWAIASPQRWWKSREHKPSTAYIFGWKCANGASIGSSKRRDLGHGGWA